MKTKTKKKVTVNTGSNMFKTRLIAYLEREIDSYPSGAGRKTGECKSLVRVLRWVRQSDERAAKKIGGLGRK